MGLADLKKKKETPKLTGLAALKARRNEPVEKLTGLAALKAKREGGSDSNGAGEKGLAALKKKREQRMKLNAKQDFIREGFKFHNCQFVPTDMDPICYGGAPGAFWSVDVTNGDKTATFHNRWGSWFSGGNDHDENLSPLPGFDPEAKGAHEPFAFWVSSAIRDRYIAELKARKLPGLGELTRQREEEARRLQKEAEEKEKLAQAREARRLRRLEAAKKKRGNKVSRH
jgi:hypothetical protein